MGNWLVHSPVLMRKCSWLACSPSMPLHPSVQHCQLSSLEALSKDFLNISTKDPVYKVKCCLHLYFMLHDSISWQPGVNKASCCLGVSGSLLGFSCCMERVCPPAVPVTSWGCKWELTAGLGCLQCETLPWSGQPDMAKPLSIATTVHKLGVLAPYLRGSHL